MEHDYNIDCPSADLLQKKLPTYNTSKDGTAYNPKFSKGSTARPSQITGWRRPKRWCKVVAVIAITCLFFVPTYFGFQWWRLHWGPEKPNYAIVLDCGSTGTRVQVYAWAYKDSSGPDRLPIVIRPTFQHLSGKQAGRKIGARAYNRMETEPGFDKLLKNQSGVRAAIEPLLEWAKKQIPPSAHRNTPLFFLGTAGLRRLPVSDAEWLLDKAWYILERSPFMCRRSWVKVISGVEEAYYGWVALNYKFHRLGQASRQSTFGALDLGGSSLQVTFESEELIHSEDDLSLRVGSVDHHLYAHSHAGFGLNDAFDRSVGLVWNDLQKDKVDIGTEREVRHPCLHAGYKRQYTCSSCTLQSSAESFNAVVSATDDNRSKIALVGEPDWEACKLLANNVVNASRLSLSPQAVDCVEPPCALGRHQPSPLGQFCALSGFFVVYKFFGLLPTNASFAQLLHQGKSFCAKQWKEALDSVVPQPLVEHYCFRAPYVVALLQDGLHLEEDQIFVGSGDISWTLGAALLEAGAFVPSKKRDPAPSSFQNSSSVDPFLMDAGTLTVFLLAIMILVLFAVTFFRNCTSLFGRKLRLPLFTRPSLGPLRFGLNKGVTAVQNGDGRFKVPLSPAPLGTVQDHHPQKFTFPIPGVASPISESPAVAGMLSGPYKTVKVPHKGSSQLSSRRSSSRDDLNSILL